MHPNQKLYALDNSDVMHLELVATARYTKLSTDRDVPSIHVFAPIMKRSSSYMMIYPCRAEADCLYQVDGDQFNILISLLRAKDILWGYRKTKAGTTAAVIPRKEKILAVSSGGGHWVELIRLSSAFEGHIVVYATVDKAYRSEIGAARFYTIRDVTRWNKLRWVQTCAKLAFILLLEKPDVVISTGALPGYFALRLAKWFGVRTIWLDSIANVEELSLSGQMIGKHADLWLTQWPRLARPGGPLYRGTVL